MPGRTGNVHASVQRYRLIKEVGINGQDPGRHIDRHGGMVAIHGEVQVTLIVRLIHAIQLPAHEEVTAGVGGHTEIDGGIHIKAINSVVGAATMDQNAAAAVIYVPLRNLNVNTNSSDILVGSTTGHGGTTEIDSDLLDDTVVNLSVPAVDPVGYTFSEWSVNTVSQGAGVRSIDFTMTEDINANAVYITNYNVVVNSSPMTGVSISSTSGHDGVTKYTKAAVLNDTVVNLNAEVANDPAGYVFTHWTVNAVAQPDDQRSIDLTINATTTAIAVYAPTNDDFANATVLSGDSASSTATNAGGSRESGEPDHAGKIGGKSNWWTWTASFTGSVTISTAGSSFDTLLGVYTGSAVNSLTAVASNDDGSGLGKQSSVNFNSVSGTTYRIAVDGFSGATGNISLSLALKPLITLVAYVPTAAEPTSHGAFRIYRTGPLTSDCPVTLVFSGTALQGVDYKYNSKTTSDPVRVAIIPATREWLGIQVTVISDAITEDAETVIATIQPDANYGISGSAAATVTIASELVSGPVPTVTLVANDPDAGEGTPANIGAFRLIRTGDTSAGLGVTVSIGGTATSGIDYKSLSGSSTKYVIIPPGRSSVGMAIQVFDDGDVEGPETVTMTLVASPLYAVGSPSTDTVTITDDDTISAPDFSPDVVTVDESLPGIHLVAPDDIGLGVEMSIVGLGFGTGKVKASLVDGKKSYRLQVLSVSDTEIRVKVRSGKAGSYGVTVKLANGTVYSLADAARLVAPAPADLAGASVERGGTITLTGAYFGAVKGSVKLGNKRVAVKSWSDNSITIKVPKGFALGEHTVTVQTKLGSGSTADTLLVF